jgi:hypothetical protein
MESVPETLQVNPVALHSALMAAKQVAATFDILKKLMFYRREVDDKAFVQSASIAIDALIVLGSIGHAGKLAVESPEMFDEEKLPEVMKTLDLSRINIRLLHAAIGCFTEAGELCEAMLQQYETGELDATNYVEELGDLNVYAAFARDELGVTQGEVNAKVAAKLQKRYSSGTFTAEQANNRDLAAERDALEGKAA